MVGIKLKEFQEKCVEELLEQTVFGEKKKFYCKLLREVEKQ